MNMEKLDGRIALVTGASAGIGAAISTALVENGMIVVGVARRLDKIQVLADTLKDKKGRVIPYMCDITNDEQVYKLFEYIKENLKGLLVCINNAGKGLAKSLLEINPQEMRGLIDLNVVALCLCSQLSVALMREMKIDDGHIINISSQVASQVLNWDVIHFYTGSKYAVRALTEGLRQEMKEINSGIRVTSVSPGIVKTEMNESLWKNPSEKLKKILTGAIPMNCADIAEAVIYVLTRPATVEVNDILLTPTFVPKY